MRIFHREIITVLGKVVHRKDPERMGRIRVIVPDLGITNPKQPTGWIRRSALSSDHRVPKVDDTVLLHGFMSGASMTLFYLGEIHSTKDKPPGHGSDMSPEEYADSIFQDFGSPTSGALFYFHAQDKQLVIRTKGGNPAQIILDVETNQITIKRGGGDVLFEDTGARLAMIGDSVQVNPLTGWGTITSGSVPAQARFPW